MAPVPTNTPPPLFAGLGRSAQLCQPLTEAPPAVPARHRSLDLRSSPP